MLWNEERNQALLNRGGLEKRLAAACLRRFSGCGGGAAALFAVFHFAERLVDHFAGIDQAQMAVAQQFLAAAARHGVGLAAVADEHEQRAVAAGPGELGAQPLAVREQIDPGVFAQAGQVGAVAGLLLVVISTRRGGVRRDSLDRKSVV